jgi:hypothetical protein
MIAVKEECYSQQLNDTVKLLKHQAQFEEQFGQPFTELSLRSTITWLCEHGEHAAAENLRKEFRVGDKQSVDFAQFSNCPIASVFRYWWWKIDGLGKGGRWQELEAFAKSKKSPVGYLVQCSALFLFCKMIYFQPFVDICVKYNQLSEWKKYLQKMSSYEHQVLANIKTGFAFLLIGPVLTMNWLQRFGECCEYRLSEQR